MYLRGVIVAVTAFVMAFVSTVRMKEGRSQNTSCATFGEPVGDNGVFYAIVHRASLAGLGTTGSVCSCRLVH